MSVDALPGERNRMGVSRALRARREKTILVTAFEPFGGRSVNRSQLVLEHIARAAAGARGIRPDARVITRTLPVSFEKLDKALDRALACKPDAILLLGESGSAEELRIERMALNLIDARTADNDGEQPRGERVIEAGPAAYFSTLLLEPALGAVRRAGAPAALSGHAGLFACNYAYYLMLHKVHRRAGSAPPPVVFVHIPVKSRAVALRSATRGMLALVRHLIDRPEALPKPPVRRTASRGVRATPAGGRKA